MRSIFVVSLVTLFALPAFAGSPCSQEVALKCPAGEIDGCLSKPPQTTVHQCVKSGTKDAPTASPAPQEQPAPAAAKKSGPPCSQEVALKCPAGEIDGCLSKPPQTTAHECVKSAPAKDQPTKK